MFGPGGRLFRRGRRGLVPLAVLALTAITISAAGGTLSAGRGADANLNALVTNPGNLFATTSLLQPVIVSSHTTVNGGVVSVSWTPSSSFATSYDVQRSTSGTGPFTTVATITPGTTGFTEYAVPTASSQP